MDITCTEVPGVSGIAASIAQLTLCETLRTITLSESLARPIYSTPERSFFFRHSCECECKREPKFFEPDSPT